MGGGSYDSMSYRSAFDSLSAKGAAFARSATAAATGDYDTSIADILDPRKLKNGIREACLAPGFDDLLAIAWVQDLTGSMGTVPHHIKDHLPELLDLLVEQGITDHPNLMFVGHDDENVVTRAGFQMSQFEIGADKLVEALNNLVITGHGGGNRSESYHLAFYALANHTKLEGNEKGFAVFINDEDVYFDDTWRTNGTNPKIAKAVFGDNLEREVPMLESVKKVAEKYHIIVIRPAGCAANARNNAEWRKLMLEAGENPQNVIEVDSMDAIISTVAMAIGRIKGADDDELIDVLKSRGALGVDAAAKATNALVAVPVAAKGKATKAVATGGKKRVRA